MTGCPRMGGSWLSRSFHLRAHYPSPQPSPTGRGGRLAAIERPSPLPWGEGQGEGVLRHEIKWGLTEYETAFARLPEAFREAVASAWGSPAEDPAFASGAIALPVSAYGNLLICLQPERGHLTDRKAAYHDPNLPPRHAYIAFYLWLRERARIDALIHLGAHGTLEWLPGKATALSEACAPRASARPDAGDLSLYRQRSRRGRAGQAAHLRRHHRAQHAAADRNRLVASAARDRAAAGRVFGRGRARQAAPRAAGARRARRGGERRARRSLRHQAGDDRGRSADACRCLPLRRESARHPRRAAHPRRNRACRHLPRARRPLHPTRPVRRAEPGPRRRSAHRPQSLQRRSAHHPDAACLRARRAHGRGDHRPLCGRPRRLAAQHGARPLGQPDHAHGRRGDRHRAGAAWREAGVGSRIVPGDGLRDRPADEAEPAQG